MRRALTLLIALPALVVPLAAQEAPHLPDFDRRTPVVIAVENVGPAVVNIRSQDAVSRRSMNYGGLFQFFQGDPGGPVEVDPKTGIEFADRSLGSGVIVHPDGYAITNEHVIAGADRIRVKLRDGREVDAQVMNANRDNDIAVLKLGGKGPWPYAAFGDSDDLMVGETTIALGNPFGLSNSVTSGILSATGRSVRFRNREVFSDFIQTSAIINPGNSGGPLLDINGRLIGINVAIDTRGPGIGYAIPVNRVKDVMVTLLDPEMTLHAHLGLIPAREDGHLVVGTVDPDGPAMEAGVHQGDVILAVGDRPVSSLFDFNVALQTQQLGGRVPLRIARGPQVLDKQVTLAPLPLEALASQDRIRVLGMVCADLTRPAAARLHTPSHLIGPVILDVEPKGPADDIGIKKADVIIQIGAVATPDLQTLVRALRFYRQRVTSVDITIYRDDEGKMSGKIVF